MKKNFQTMNIPKLPFCTTEQAIEVIRKNIKNLNDWRLFTDFIPKFYKDKKNLKRSGKAGIFAGSLELVKEGNLSIKQENLFDDIYIKETND